MTLSMRAKPVSGCEQVPLEADVEHRSGFLEKSIPVGVLPESKSWLE
jgi:hypothetical protein